MKAGSSDLKFQLYSDAARSKVAPDQGYPATLMQLAVVFMGVGNGTFTFPYGRIRSSGWSQETIQRIYRLLFTIAG